jgi:hypothetical protein
MTARCAALHEVDPERRAAVALDIIAVARLKFSREHRRPTAITLREAFAAAYFESMVLYTAWANQLNGEQLTEKDNERVRIAMAQLLALFEEAY